MNDRFEDLRTFVTVAQSRSFGGAADRLGLVKSAISRRIAEMEARLGVRLLSRSHRMVRLTDAGDDFYWRAVAILASLQEAEHLASAASAEPSGRVRLAAPSAFATLRLAPILGEFLARHPRITLDVHARERPFDIVAEGYDLAIIPGDLKDSSLTARRLRADPFVCVASPSYWDINGRPTTPAELSAHRRILFTGQGTAGAWKLGGEVAPAPPTALTFNSYDAVRSAAAAGAGVGLLPLFVACRDLDCGVLEAVLQAYEATPERISLVFPSQGAGRGKVRVLIDFLLAHLGDGGGGLTDTQLFVIGERNRAD